MDISYETHLLGLTGWRVLYYTKPLAKLIGQAGRNDRNLYVENQKEYDYWYGMFLLDGQDPSILRILAAKPTSTFRLLKRE